MVLVWFILKGPW